MSIAYRASSEGHTGSSGSLSVVLPVPTGTVAGDLMVAALVRDTVAGYPATPSGWTLLSHGLSTYAELSVYYRVASSSEPGGYTWSASGTTRMAGVIVSWSGVDTSNPIAVNSISPASATSSSVTAPSVTTPNATAVMAIFDADWQYAALSTPSGLTVRQQTRPGGVASNMFPLLVVADFAQAASGATGDLVASDTGGRSGYGMGAQIALKSLNSAPNAPSWVTPQNSTIPADQDAYIELAFSDPDPGDSMSASNWKRWTLDASGNRVGSAVTTYQPTPSTKLLIPAGTLTSGTKYEFQADTLDSQGAEGPYGASLFVTARNTPGAPTITDPTSGATIGTSSYTFVISTPSLQESEWTLYADDGAGGIDTSTILQGPVSVTTGDLRSHTFTGLVNNVPVWASVRIKDGGLWSQPRQQRNPVSYTPPAAPTITLTPVDSTGMGYGTDALRIDITNPAGGTATSYNNVYVDDGKGKGKERVATMLPTNTPWTYALPVSLRDYSGNLWVEAVGVNGTTAETAA